MISSKNWLPYFVKTGIAKLFNGAGIPVATRGSECLNDLAPGSKGAWSLFDFSGVIELLKS